MSKIPTEGNLLVSVKITNANTLWPKNTKINSGICITDIFAHVQRGIAAMLCLFITECWSLVGRLLIRASKHIII